MRRPAATGGRAAPLPSKTRQLGIERFGGDDPLVHIRGWRRRRPDRRRSGGSRRSAARRGPRSRDDRRPRGARRAQARAMSSRSEAAPPTSGSGGPPRPIARTTTCPRAPAYGPTWPVTAVFPTRLPVPTIASDGKRNRLEPGRVEAKVGADIRHTHASDRDASRNRSTGPSTGSSERSKTISGPVLEQCRLDGAAASGRRSPRPAELLSAADKYGRDGVEGQPSSASRTTP